MNINHHPDDSTLVSYAAGSLAEPMQLIVDCHLTWCMQCRERIGDAEQVGGTLLAGLAPLEMKTGSVDRILEAIDRIGMPEIGAAPTESTPSNDPGQVPDAIRRLVGNEYDAIRWQTMAPGIKQFSSPLPGGARLLKIAPGTSMPLHSHGGSELTLILQGSYCDEVGRFSVGDVADLDPDIEHQPIADTERPCICLTATDAPLRFKGIVPRLLQPFFGI